MPAFTIEVTSDMCAEIAACSGSLTKRGPVYIWNAPIDDWARAAVDIATDFAPGVAQAKAAYDAYQRIQNGEDPLDVLAAAGADAALGLIPGLKAGNKARKALGKADDVADAAGDVGKAAGNVGRGGTKLRPDSSAQGPHSTFKRDPQTGKVTGHAEWDAQGNPVKRTDVTGAAHGSVKTPHTHEYGPPNVDPASGKSYPGNQTSIRPATPDEIPR